MYPPPPPKIEIENNNNKTMQFSKYIGVYFEPHLSLKIDSN